MKTSAVGAPAFSEIGSRSFPSSAPPIASTLNEVAFSPGCGPENTASAAHRLEPKRKRTASERLRGEFMARERGGKTDENETGFAGICFLPMDLDDRAAVACQGWRAIVGQREDDVDARGRRIGWQREAHRFTGLRGQRGAIRIRARFLVNEPARSEALTIGIGRACRG